MTGQTAGTTRARNVVQGVLVVVLVVVGLSLLTTVIVTAIWPGEARLTAAVLCDEAHPDAYVVVDHESGAGEATSDYSLYCVDARGGTVEVGWMDPFLLLTAAHALVFLLVLAPLVAVSRLGARTDSG